MAYLIDTDVLIRAKNLHYGFDLCPGFWDWLVAANGNGKVFSIEKVLDELRAGDDDLAEWATAHRELFIAPSEQTIAALTQATDWAMQQEFQPTAIDTFLQGADCFLVAEALAQGFDVVTHEIPSDSVRRVKIPNVCIGLGVKCLEPFQMLRLEKARFVLEAV